MFKIIRYLASPMLMAFLFVALAVSSAVATFVENDFGTLTAKALIYNSWWFEFIMFALAVNFLASIYTRKLYRKEKMSILMFHIGFVVILLGAAITRYLGHEGMMHIREGQQGNTYISYDKWLKIYANDELKIAKQVDFTPKTRNKFNTSIKYNNNRVNIELINFIPSSSVLGLNVLAFNINMNGAQHKVFIPYSNSDSEPIKHKVDGITIGFKYGPKTVEIPFSIKLNEFILERYPGSDSPSYFISEVTVVDNEMGIEKPYSIFMNNILNYRGYRFYQSSYDPDEKGTYLSVNNDFWGTLVTYFGYLILIIGIVWSLFARGSRFRSLISKPGAVAVLAIGLLFPMLGFAQDIPKPDANHARKFGELQVQDRGGRVKPLSTLANEVLRKLNRSNKFQGLSPEQTYLSMSSFPEHWQHIPVIRIKNKELRSIIGIKGDHASFIDFFDHQADGTYKLIRLVQEAFSFKPSQRTGLHKEVIKADEKVNIMFL